jgi:spore coat polysaccharide biosynthesis predicted glycosyltransferase SpsG
MKVCILTEGGKNIGFGHITRCTSIYQAFEEIGISPEFIVNGDENVRGLLQDKNSKVFDWLNNQETLLAIVRNADIAFIDSYLADYSLYEKISKLVETGVYFDDDIRIEYPKGFVLNGTVLAKQMPYPKKKDVTYLLGPQYIPLRKAFWNIPAKLIHDKIETVMITFGGADIRNLTPRVLTWLTDMYPELLKRVIVGKGFKNIAEIERLRDSNTELIYYPGAAEMKKVMLESDIAIAASGQTLYELARIGVPTIGICVAENQLQNTQGWKEASFLEYAGRYDDEDLERRLKDSIGCLVQLSVRSERSRIGRKVVDGQGCKRIVKAVVSI